MSFNRFNITTILLCILIAITGVALTMVWANSEFRIAKFTVSIIWILLIIALIKYVNKTNRSLTQFLNSLKYNDYVAQTNTSKSFKELSLSFNEIIRYVRIAELEKESTQHYLRHILDEMPTGIITVNEKGYVEIINRTGLDILEIDHLDKISQLNFIEQGFADKVLEIPKSQRRIISLNTTKGLKSILFKTKEALVNQRKIRIISFENIRTELDFEEEKTWKKIFRVLTHEIMNSIAPIRSLTASVLKIFAENNKTKPKEHLTENDIESAVKGLKSIDNRNQGLSRFVSEFKKLMRIPEPQTKREDINQFMDETTPILKELCSEKNIKIIYKPLSKSAFVLIDKEQIKQVLINLVKNATEAVQENTGIINIDLRLDDNILSVEILDNGEGIPKDILPEIFIPFFTTKKEGSGIGLSVSRQIMRNHGGKLHISSLEQKGTKCELIFPI